MKKLIVGLLLLGVVAPGLIVSPVLAKNQGQAEQVVAKVNINQATAEEFQTLPGIGQAIAERIVTYRDANGAFKSVDQLTAVRGIGARKLAKLRANLSL